jgi:hypothetical protein
MRIIFESQCQTLPPVKLLYGGTPCGEKNAHQMSKDCLPNSKLELMEKVHNEQDKEIE